MPRATTRPRDRKIPRHFRRLAGLTQRAAAEWYGVAERTWRRYETGETAVPAPLKLRIYEWAMRTCPAQVRDLT